MSLSSRAIALQGIGFGALLIAAQGFIGLDSQSAQDSGADDSGYVSPVYDAYVKRINDERAAEWIRDVEARTERARPSTDRAGVAPHVELAIQVPSARVMDLAGTKAKTKQDAQPNEEDEIAKIMAMVLVLTDD